MFLHFASIEWLTFFFFVEIVLLRFLFLLNVERLCELRTMNIEQYIKYMYQLSMETPSTSDQQKQKKKNLFSLTEKDMVTYHMYFEHDDTVIYCWKYSFRKTKTTRERKTLKRKMREERRRRFERCERSELVQNGIFIVYESHFYVIMLSNLKNNLSK